MYGSNIYEQKHDLPIALFRSCGNLRIAITRRNFQKKVLGRTSCVILERQRPKLPAVVVIETLKAHIDNLSVEIDEIDTDMEDSQALVM